MSDVLPKPVPALLLVNFTEGIAFPLKVLVVQGGSKIFPALLLVNFAEGIAFPVKVLVIQGGL